MKTHVFRESRPEWEGKITKGPRKRLEMMDMLIILIVVMVA